jgi:NlpC/P60 family protein
VASSVQEFLNWALRQKGEPYVWGDEGPNGFDCSGLVWYAAHKAGLNIPRLTANGYMASTPNISRSNLQPGDLLFFNYGRLGAGAADHVGIYLGNGRMVNAANTQEDVNVEAVDWGNFIGGGRFRQLSGNAGPVSGGGGGVGGAGGGFAAAGVTPQVSKQDLADVLQGFGLRAGLFSDLLERAVRENWSDTHFLSMVYQSAPFQKAFPGILRPDGSLRMTPGEYLGLADTYRDIASNFGINLNRDKIGVLVTEQVSPDEWFNRATVFQSVKRSPALRDALNEVLTRDGRKRLDEKGMFDFLQGKAEADLYDLYEAAVFRRAGVDVDLEAASKIGQAGEFVDTNALVGQIELIRDFIRPELSAAGISDADIAVLKAGGEDPSNISGRLEQIIRNREALVGARGAGGLGSQGQQGPFPEMAVGL